jgi:hypothetical protein
LLVAYKVSRWVLRREQPSLLDDDPPPKATHEQLADLEDELRTEMGSELSSPNDSDTKRAPSHPDQAAGKHRDR